MHVTPRIVLLGLCLLAGGCGEDTDPVPGDTSAATVERRAAFFWVQDDEPTPVMIAHGVLSLPASLEYLDRFDGSWRLEATGAANVDDPSKPDFLAPLAGRGKLTGERTEQGWVVELYPSHADNNVGIILGPDLLGEGQWQHVTFVGIAASGAVRITSDTGE